MRVSHFPSGFGYLHSLIQCLYAGVRYFMIKSWNHENVLTAQRDGLWATQTKNEEILTEAFRGARHVVLLFSVNKSMAFQGCVSLFFPLLLLLVSVALGAIRLLPSKNHQVPLRRTNLFTPWGKRKWEEGHFATSTGRTLADIPRDQFTGGNDLPAPALPPQTPVLR